MKRASQMLQRNHADSARRVLEPLISGPLSERQKEPAREMLAEIDGRTAISRAMALARAGKYAEARAALAKILQTPVGDELRVHVKKRIADLDALIKAR
jgi:hypothetical protein